MDAFTIPSTIPTITLRDITSQNWHLVTRLRVRRQQQGNLPPNPISMLETIYSENTSMCAVYADEIVVGFLVLATHPPAPHDGYYVWRFMIDWQYQWMGLGKQAINLAIQHIKDTYPAARKLRLMSAPREGNGRVREMDSPFTFFEKLGFKEVDQTVEEEEIMSMMEVELERDESTTDGADVATQGQSEEVGMSGEGGSGVGWSMSLAFR